MVEGLILIKLQSQFERYESASDNGDPGRISLVDGLMNPCSG